MYSHTNSEPSDMRLLKQFPWPQMMYLPDTCFLGNSRGLRCCTIQTRVFSSNNSLNFVLLTQEYPGLDEMMAFTHTPFMIVSVYGFSLLVLFKVYHLILSLISHCISLVGPIVLFLVGPLVPLVGLLVLFLVGPLVPLVGPLVLFMVVLVPRLVR